MPAPFVMLVSAALFRGKGKPRKRLLDRSVTGDNACDRPWARQRFRVRQVFARNR